MPEAVVPDNLKAAVFEPVRSRWHDRTQSKLSRSRDTTVSKVDPTPPLLAPKKGKVEARVKYVKGNFFAGREGSDVTVARAELARWNTEIASVRTHGTTGKRPVDVFRQLEVQALLALPERPYEVVVWKKARVHRDAHTQFDGRLYSVPWKHIGRQVWR